MPQTAVPEVGADRQQAGRRHTPDPDSVNVSSRTTVGEAGAEEFSGTMN